MANSRPLKNGQSRVLRTLQLTRIEHREITHTGAIYILKNMGEKALTPILDEVDKGMLYAAEGISIEHAKRNQIYILSRLMDAFYDEECLSWLTNDWQYAADVIYRIGGIETRGFFLDFFLGDNGDDIDADLAIKYFISNDNEIDKKNQDGDTLLHSAVERGWGELVQLLIEKGADLNATDKLGRTPLKIAEDSGNDIIAKMLSS